MKGLTSPDPGPVHPPPTPTPQPHPQPPAPPSYYMMNQQQEIMVLSIGLGVGVAAVLGTLKFLYDLSLKLMIAGCLAPTIAAACYMQWYVCGGLTRGGVGLIEPLARETRVQILYRMLLEV